MKDTRGGGLGVRDTKREILWMRLEKLQPGWFSVGRRHPIEFLAQRLSPVITHSCHFMKPNVHCLPTKMANQPITWQEVNALTRVHIENCSNSPVSKMSRLQKKMGFE